MARFDQLVARYGAAEDEEQRRAAEQRIWDTFGQQCAVFVSDLSGFSRLTERYSIIHFLALIRECRNLLFPVIEQAGGSPVKATADNMYAIFPDAARAIEGSIAMQRVLRRRNESHHPDFQIGLCVGIGYGKVLVIEEADFFGHELNLAFKLGEDTAEPGEILVTRAAIQQAGTGAFAHEDRTVSMSGITIDHVAVHYD